IDRPSPQWTLTRAWRLLYVEPLDREELAALAALAHLPDSWRGLAERRLATGLVEDWTRSLSGEASRGCGQHAPPQVDYAVLHNPGDPRGQFQCCNRYETASTAGWPGSSLAPSPSGASSGG